jgi:hypothetical protein
VNAAALGCRNHRRVDRSERKIVIAGDELCHAQQVRRSHGFDREVPVGEIAEEPDLRLPSEAR